VSSANLLRIHSIPSSRSSIQILKKMGLWGASHMTGHQLDLTPFTATFWAQPSSQFFTQQRVYLSKPWAASFSRRILWEENRRLAFCFVSKYRKGKKIDKLSIHCRFFLFA